MTPKEKAEELVRNFYSIGAIECKQCALIAVDEILKSNPVEFENVLTFTTDKITKSEWVMINNKEYWQQVKKYISYL
jgi:hypothetical protein